jgi:virginiamycin B lyase
MVWLSNWDREQTIVRFDPTSETFSTTPLPGADVREIQGRPGEIWAAESARDRLVVIRH